MVKKPKTYSGLVLPYRASCRPDTTKLVDVPIRVQVPPSRVAYDMGSNSFLGLMPHLKTQQGRVRGHVTCGEGEGGRVSLMYWRGLRGCHLSEYSGVHDRYVGSPKKHGQHYT